MPYIPVRWLLLRFGFSGPFVVMHINTSDEQRESVYQLWQDVPGQMLSNVPVPSALWSALNSSISRLITGLPSSRHGPHSTGPVPVAVFLDSSLHPGLRPLLDFLAETLELNFAPDRLEVVRMIRFQPLRRDSLRLPLKIAAVKPADDALQSFLLSTWMNDEDVQDFGIKIAISDSLEQALEADSPDILLMERWDTKASNIQQLLPGLQPRLIITFSWAPSADIEKIPHGTAYLLIPSQPHTEKAKHFMKDLAYAILHDLPLHEAVKAAKRRNPLLSSALLIGDPLSIEYLRLTDAFADIQRRGHQWQTSLPQLDFDALIERIRQAEPDLAKKVRSAIESAQHKEEDFEIDRDEIVPNAIKKTAEAANHILEFLSLRQTSELSPDMRKLLTSTFDMHLKNLSLYLDKDKVSSLHVSRVDIERLRNTTLNLLGLGGTPALNVDFRILKTLKDLKTVERIVTTPPTTIRRYRDWAEQFRTLPAEFTDFQQEDQGFVPMAHMEAEAADLKDSEEHVRAGARELLADPVVANTLRRYQRRRVDVALFRRSTDPVLLPLEKNTTLAVSAEYDLRFHIGNRQAESLMAGSPPPVDPLLPDPENEKGYMLDIVLQPKDFEHISPPMISMRLPVFGGSDPIYYRVRTPKKTGQAQLRIALYYRNHLLQSFLFTAKVQNQETYLQNDTALDTELEFSRIESFADVDTLKERALSIGVNQNIGSSTHELIIKADNTVSNLSLFPIAFSGVYSRFRKELEAAVRNPARPSQPRVFPVVRPGQPAQEEAAIFLKSWMKTGSDLYSALFDKAPSELRIELQKLRQTTGKTIQAIRFNENFLFPWVLLYDYLLPREVVGAASLPACLGTTVAADGSVVECGHDHTTRAFCVKGFWVMRHMVEEMIRRNEGTSEMVPKLKDGSVRFIGDPALSETSQLATDLEGMVGTTQLARGPSKTDSLLNLLWQDPPARPSILVFLSHMETGPIPGHPSEPHITVGPNEYLVVRDINDRKIQVPNTWHRPRPIVFLMACESSTTTAETINDFVTAWNGAGAAAIVGTEAVVASDMAAAFAGEMVKSLWNGSSLGKAFFDIRKKMLEEGNPLAFLFQAVGDVDIVVQ